MTIYNSISKIANRTASELNGLKISLFESSNDSIGTLLEETTTFNSNDSYNIIDRYIRPINDYTGLLINAFEISKDKTTVKINKIKLISPKKTYTNNIKLIRKYSNKTLY